MRTMNRNVVLISLAFLLCWLGFDGAQQYFVPILQMQGREGQALMLLSVIYATYLVSNVFAPWILSIIGLKAGMILGLVPYGLFLLFVPMASVGWLVALSIGVGAGAGLVWNGSSQAIAAHSESGDVGANLGMQYSALQLGGLVGVTAGGYLLRFLTTQQLFSFFALFVGLAIVSLLFTRLTHVNVARKRVDLRYLISRHALLLFPLIFGGYYVLIGAVGAYALIVTSIVGVHSLVYFVTPMGVASVLGSYLIGKRADNYAKVPIIYGLCGLGVVGMACITLFQSQVLLMFGSIALGVFIGSVYSVVLSLLKERVLEDEFNKAVGVFYVYNTAGMLAGLLVTSLIDPRMSYVPAFICLVIAVPCTRIFHRENPILT